MSPALHDAKQCLRAAQPVGFISSAGIQLFGLQSVKSHARPAGASPAAHSSNAMTMSEPNAACTSIEISGDKNLRLPSTCERNSVPSSVIFRKAPSDQT